MFPVNWIPRLGIAPKPAAKLTYRETPHGHILVAEIHDYEFVVQLLVHAVPVSEGTT